MRTGTNWIVSSLLRAAATSASAQAPLINHTFKDSDGGWTAIGQDGKVAVSHTAGITLPAAGALKFDYQIQKGGFSAINLATPLDSLTKAKSFKLRIRTDSATLIGIVLEEQDGGRYVATCMAPKDAWQPIELATSDFILSRDPGDPVDPDGKLDMDKVHSISVFDVSEFLVQVGADNPVLAAMLDIRKGDHTLYMDSFSIGTEAVPTSTSSLGSDVTIEAFVHPQLSWFGLGGVSLTRSSGAPIGSAGMKAAYHQAPGKIAILNRPIPSWVFVGAKTLAFDAASLKEATLNVTFEQTDGGKYNMTVVVPAGSDVKHIKLALVGFQRSDDSKDTATKINLGLIKSMNIIDLSGMISKADADNTLWVGPIHALGN